MTLPRSKSDTLYQQLQDDILSLRLAPGMALRLPVLSATYKMGLTPIRECLNRLCSEHFVVPEHNKGFHVAPLSLPDLLDIERSRSDIEGSLLVDAISCGDDAWEASIIGTFYQLSKTPVPSVLHPTSDMQLWEKRHDVFHDSLLAAAPSIWKHRFRNQLVLQLSRYHLFIQNGLRDLATSHPEIATQAADAFAKTMEIEPHEALYKVALNRDAPEAKRVFEAHSSISIQAFERLKSLVPDTVPVASLLRHHSEEAHT